MVCAFLLARMGIEVVVLEKHADFLRDFRGDTIHPSTLEIMHELGILDEFLKCPHQKVYEIAGQVGHDNVKIADFRHLPTTCKFVVLMPQWDFLDFIKAQAGKYRGFHLRMVTKATGVIEERGVVVGVRAETSQGPLEIRAGLTIGADGRHSIIRQSANLKVMDIGAPMDVLWMRLSRGPTDPARTFGHFDRGKILVLINRGDYWQCAFVIAKGQADKTKEKGLPAFREELAGFEPFLKARVDELKDWKDVSLLTVSVDRLEKWSKAGLLCIGDSAHAMSPIGGVGINLAIQDAVATANLLGPILVERVPSESELELVQQRRNFPTRATQKLQVLAQNNIIGKVLASTKPQSAPWPLKLLDRVELLRRIPAHVIGVGFRPEHIKTPAIR